MLWTIEVENGPFVFASLAEDVASLPLSSLKIMCEPLRDLSADAILFGEPGLDEPWRSCPSLASHTVFQE